MDDFHDEPLKLEIDPMFLKNQATRTRISKYHHLLRKALELLLPVSLLSLLLTFFTGVSFLQSYTYYFSTFLFPLLTQVLERKYMFLLCNGILVFLAAGKSGFRSAVFSPPPPPSRLQGEAETKNVQGEIMIRYDEESHTILQPSAVPVNSLYEEETGTCVQTVGFPYTVSSAMSELEKEQLQAKQQQEEEEADVYDVPSTIEGSEKGAQTAEVIEDQEGELDENENESIGVSREDNDTESEGPASINTEDLNKKFEEFIRKMKEELRIEAQQQQLIAA